MLQICSGCLLCIGCLVAKTSLLEPNKDCTIIAESILMDGTDPLAIFEHAELRLLQQLILNADRLWIKSGSEAPIVFFNGNVAFTWPGIQLYGNEGCYVPGTRKGQLSSIHYYLKSVLGSGCAKAAYWDEETLILMDAVSHTCTGDQPLWSLNIKKLDCSLKTKRLVLRGLVLKLGPIPIFYWPYLGYTIGESGVVGFLAPFGTSQTTQAFAYRSAKDWQLGIPVGWQFAPSSRFFFMPLWNAQRGLSLHLEGTLADQRAGALRMISCIETRANQPERFRPYAAQLYYETPTNTPFAFQIDAYHASDLKTAQTIKRLPESLLQFEEVNYLSWKLQQRTPSRSIIFHQLNTSPFTHSQQLDSSALEDMASTHRLLHGDFTVQHLEHRSLSHPISLQTALETLYYEDLNQATFFNYWYLEPQVKGRLQISMLQLRYQLHLRTTCEYHAHGETYASQQRLQFKPAIQLELSFPLLLSTTPPCPSKSIQITPTSMVHWIPATEISLPSSLQTDSPLLGTHELFTRYSKLSPLYQRAALQTDWGCICKSVGHAYEDAFRWNVSFGARAIWYPHKDNNKKYTLKSKSWIANGGIASDPHNHCYAQLHINSAKKELEQLILRYTFQKGDRRFFQASYFFLPNELYTSSKRRIQQLGASFVHPITRTLSLISRYHYAISHGHMVESLYGLFFSSECFEVELCYNRGLSKPLRAADRKLSYDEEGLTLSFRWLGWSQLNARTPLDVLKNGRLKTFPTTNVG